MVFVILYTNVGSVGDGNGAALGVVSIFGYCRSTYVKEANNITLRVINIEVVIAVILLACHSAGFVIGVFLCP